MYIFLMVIHVFVCFVLMAVILLQAGRGGGLSDIAGNQPQSILGTQTNTFMTRATEVCAIIFIVTSLSLGILSTQRGKSLVERQKLMRSVKAALPMMPDAAKKEILVEKAQEPLVPPSATATTAPATASTATPVASAPASSAPTAASSANQEAPKSK